MKLPGATLDWARIVGLAAAAATAAGACKRDQLAKAIEHALNVSVSENELNTKETG